MTAPVSNEEDLDALFERVASERVPTVQAAAPASVQAAKTVEKDTNAVVAQTGDGSPPDIFDRIGKLTRNLHDALIELGYDKAVQSAVSTLPDTRDRLAYIANLTGQAAERTLGAIETAKPVQEQMQKQATELSAKWDRLLAGNMSLDEFKSLALHTNRFLHAIPGHTEHTNNQLLEIMMAQDFHDLTGQVIKKIVDLAQRLEGQLLQLLLETSATQQGGQPVDVNMNLNGPVISADGRTDVVTSQEQVDDLLGSLGF
ncbi:MAG: protein phosphatase CheZ [Pseudomonadota bacterium]